MSKSSKTSLTTDHNLGTLFEFPSIRLALFVSNAYSYAAYPLTAPPHGCFSFLL